MSWRRLRTLILREIRATLRDPFTVSILIIVPLLALILFSEVLSTEVQDLPLGVLDADHSNASRRLMAELTAQGTFSAQYYAHREDVDAALVDGDIGAALIIPPDFDRRLQAAGGRLEKAQVQVLYDGGEAVLAGNAEAFLRGLLTTTTGAVLDGDGHTVPPGGVQVVTRGIFNAKLSGTPYMVSGTFGFVLSFLTVLITAVSIVNEKLTGTFEQLQVTPANAVEILLGKILPLGGVFALDVVLMVLIAGLALGVWPQGSTLFFVLVSTFYVLVSLAQGVVISATSATAAEAVQKSVLFSVPLIHLSGFAFPIRSMPWVVQWVSELLPATHYIRVSRAIYMRGAGPLAMAPELALLLLFGVALMVFALRRIEARV
jgi:ABC-2 type transport system permease protein